MHIALLSPSDKSYISKFLPNINIDDLPIGYTGAIFIGSLIGEYLNKGHKVTAITTTVAINNDYSIQSFTNGNFTWIVVPSRPHSIRMNGFKLGRIIDLFSMETNRMVKVIKEIKPDIVHAHWSYEFAKAARVSGVPNLITVHDNANKVFWFYKNIYRLGRLLMSEINLRKAQYLTTVSPYMLSYVKNRSNSKDVKVIPNPVPVALNINNIDLLIQKRLLSIGSPRIVMINNGWSKHKNVIMGILAFQLIQNKFPEAELHLFGDGYEKTDLVNQEITRLEIKNIYLYGQIINAELIKKLATYHLLLHTSLEESFGVVLIEAMSLGVPVIGGEFSGAVPWVVNNHNLLTDVSDKYAIAKKIEKLLINRTLYANLSLLSYKNVVSRFSSLSVVNNYIAYYNEILKK